MSEIYLVTGATGHLGNTIVKKLVDMGRRVRAVVLPGDKNVSALPEEAEVYYGDVREKASLENAFKAEAGEDVIVIHCAGIVTISSRYNENVYKVNVEGTKNVTDLCVENKVKKLVHVSSVHAIPEKPHGETIREINHFDPDKVVGLYAKTKAEATQYVLDKAKATGLNASVVHPSGISGPYDSGKGHITQLLIDYCDGGLTAGVKGGYDFVDVRDVADGIIACCEHGRSGECYILSNRYISIPELFGIFSQVTGRKKIRTILPLWFAKATAGMAEMYYRIKKQPPLYTAYSLYTLSSNAQFSHEKAEKELGYVPRDFTVTVRDTVQWLTEHGRIKMKKLRPARRGRKRRNKKAYGTAG
jgi:dihydroflavonol-4-reductase